MKKIISYSLWGDNPKYIQGALENIKGQKEFYPDWICRFYTHMAIPEDFISELKKEGAEVIIRNDIPFLEHMNAPGMFWRFEVLKDPDVEKFMIRDADGRLTQREKNCVTDWEKSSSSFHIIRDNLYHATKIMGGMWGATKEFADNINYDELLNLFHTSSYKNIYATDQEFLAHMIYPLVKDTACIHDDWDRYGEGARKVPHFRIGKEYIGEPIEIK